MLSAICFNLDQCKILLSGNGLKEKKRKKNTVGEGKKILEINIFFPVSTAFFTIAVNIVGNLEKADYQHFFFFLQFFWHLSLDNATMSSIWYFEIMYRILCKTKGSRPC